MLRTSTPLPALRCPKRVDHTLSVIQTPQPSSQQHGSFNDDSDNDSEVINSPLNQKSTRQGVTVDIAIYGDGEGRWILEVEDCDSNSYIWVDHFETDQHALDEAIHAFEENPTSYSGALDHERHQTIEDKSPYHGICPSWDTAEGISRMDDN